MIAMLSRSSAAHRAQVAVKRAAKDSARAKMALLVAASRASCAACNHVERLTPAASQGPVRAVSSYPRAPSRQRSERKRITVRRLTGSGTGNTMKKALDL